MHEDAVQDPHTWLRILLILFFFEYFYAFLEKSYIIMIIGAPSPLNDVSNGSTFFLKRYAGTRTEDI